jgi:hypothetical protein
MRERTTMKKSGKRVVPKTFHHSPLMSIARLAVRLHRLLRGCQSLLRTLPQLCRGDRRRSTCRPLCRRRVRLRHTHKVPCSSPQHFALQPRVGPGPVHLIQLCIDGRSSRGHCTHVIHGCQHLLYRYRAAVVTEHAILDTTGGIGTTNRPSGDGVTAVDAFRDNRINNTCGRNCAPVDCRKHTRCFQELQHVCN